METQVIDERASQWVASTRSRQTVAERLPFQLEDDRLGIAYNRARVATEQIVEGIADTKRWDMMSKLPIAQWLPRMVRERGPAGEGFGRKVMNDVVTSVTISAVLVPQGLAYGGLAGVEPIVGLYTSLLPLICYMCFGTCRHLAVGPFALISMLSAEAIMEAGEARCVPLKSGAGSESCASNLVREDCVGDLCQWYLTSAEAIRLSSILSFLVGCVMLLMASLKLGFIAGFLSDPVLSGFCTACSIVIPTSQMKYAFGIAMSRALWASTIYALFAQLPSWKATNIVFFVFSFAELYGLQWLNQRRKSSWPAELIVVVTMTGFNFCTSKMMDEAMLGGSDVVGHIEPGLPSIRFPLQGLKLSTATNLLPRACLIAIMIYATSLTASKTFATKFNYSIDNNQELLAFGMMNLVGSFTGCFPAASSLSRSAIVGSSKSSSPAHGLFTCLFIAILLNIPGQMLFYLPKPTLAAIVILSFKGLFLNGIAESRLLYGISFRAWGMWGASFLATLFWEIVPALALSVAINIMYLFYQITRPSSFELGRVRGTERKYRPADVFPEAELIPRVAILCFAAPLHFANKDVFFRAVHGSISAREDIEAVVIDASPIGHIDITAARTLQKLATGLATQGLRLVLANCNYEVHSMLEKVGLFKMPTDQTYEVIPFCELHDAVGYAEGKLVLNVESREERTGSSNRSSMVGSRAPSRTGTPQGTPQLTFQGAPTGELRRMSTTSYTMCESAPGSSFTERLASKDSVPPAERDLKDT